MYIFFTLFGFLFISIAATFLNYIYDVFSINKITNFLMPINNRSVWNRISVTILPAILWSFIELPILGYNENFILATVVSIILSCLIIYEIKYSALMFFNKENNMINLISIFVATFFSQAVSFMILKMDSLFAGNMLISIISVLAILLIYVLLKLFPPKTSFFRGSDIKD